MTKPCVFIHTNERQYLGALVSRHSLLRNSQHREAFDVKIIHTKDHPFLREREGQPFLREGGSRVWRYDDLQSFTPLRFMPPELMGYEGRAVVIDPDIFAVGDVWELLTRDMDGKAIVCRSRTGSKGLDGCMASSVMLLDCAKLTHWRAKENFTELFERKRDYMEWICLKTEPRSSIGKLEDRWNDFDHLGPETKLLHNTKRQTQPWKTGLPVDFTAASKKFKATRPKTWMRPLKRAMLGWGGAPSHYQAHPDRAQQNFFFGLLRECLAEGVVTEDQLRAEMRENHIRHDALDVLKQTPPLPA
ncbi:glycosyltransferase family protein [Algihabitans albus]|uniref:hypothetical protein n=1 Tax=Algihabitans albus TaxID=2164067 RepID=UPI000E5D0BD0|nr:hypothetical protein [Algihabitans albus]